MQALSAISATLIAVAGIWAAGFCSFETSAQAQPAAKRARPLPVFEVDPNWPKMAANFKVPFVSGIKIDSHDNAWPATRPRRAQGGGMQMGHNNASKGESDTENFNRPPNVQVNPKTNELFVMIQAPGLDVPGHQIATDSKGNLYLTGVNMPGKANAERLIYKGMSAANDQ